MATKAAVTHYKKYTVQPTGIWALIHRFFAVDPNRSSGIPLNPQFRNPPPGHLDPRSYDDPVTLPAADIADNPYWKRDVRRKYPQLSVVNQGDVIGSLAAKRNDESKVDMSLSENAAAKLQIESKQFHENGLADILRTDSHVSQSVLGESEMPPLPGGLSPAEGGKKKYDLLRDEEQSYGASYSCRNFV